MIFVTVGSQKFPMNRLLSKIDDLLEAGTLNEEVIAQTGYCTYSPRYYRSESFLDKEKMDELVDACSLLICHAGSGSMMQGIKRGKKVITVPRKVEFGEHVDDHQLELAHAFCQAGYLLMTEDLSKLEEQIRLSAAFVPQPYHSSTDTYINLLTSIIK